MVGNMVGTCVPLAPSAYAGAIVGGIVEITVGAIVGVVVGAVVAMTLTTTHRGNEHLNPENCPVRFVTVTVTVPEN